MIVLSTRADKAIESSGIDCPAAVHSLSAPLFIHRRLPLKSIAQKEFFFFSHTLYISPPLPFYRTTQLYQITIAHDFLNSIAHTVGALKNCVALKLSRSIRQQYRRRVYKNIAHKLSIPKKSSRSRPSRSRPSRSRPSRLRQLYTTKYSTISLTISSISYKFIRYLFCRYRK